VWNYLDDCAIVAAHDEEATHLYRWLFAKFAERGLMVRAAKSGLYLSQMTFVGHILDENGVHASVPPLTSVARLTCARTDAITGPPLEPAPQKPLKSQKNQNTPGAGQKEVEPNTPPL
jgi:hypothetical protein